MPSTGYCLLPCSRPVRGSYCCGASHGKSGSALTGAARPAAAVGKCQTVLSEVQALKVHLAQLHFNQKYNILLTT